MDRTVLLRRTKTLKEKIEAHTRAVCDAIEEMETALLELEATRVSTPEAKPSARAADELLTAREAQERLKISASTFYDWIRTGRLPEGITYGPRSRRWRASEIGAMQ